MKEALKQDILARIAMKAGIALGEDYPELCYESSRALASYALGLSAGFDLGQVHPDGIQVGEDVGKLVMDEIKKIQEKTDYRR